jgi:S-adenosylmethionine-diacylgycerolhomoserine-N-methlytransferase
VYLSYALTMIPDWHAALANACSMLKPGGVLGVVDFYVAAADPPNGLARQSLLTRWWWPRWFAHDGVHLDPRHLQCLMRATSPLFLHERRARLPYLPGLQAPYYIYVGCTPGAAPELENSATLAGARLSRPECS